jgi:hypothetical protein
VKSRQRREEFLPFHTASLTQLAQGDKQLQPVAPLAATGRATPNCSRTDSNLRSSTQVERSAEMHEVK